MEHKEIVRKTVAFAALLLIAAVVLVLMPPGIRLPAALIALPLETLMLTLIVGGSKRQVPQP